MKEGKYSIQFAQDERISVHYYNNYYNNEWSGRKIVNDLKENETHYSVSSNSAVTTNYIIKPDPSDFMDCFSYALHPPYLDSDVKVGNISCESYNMILLDPSRQHLSRNLKSEDMFGNFCLWKWNETQKVFQVSINNSYQLISRYLDNIVNEYSYKNEVKMALTCNLQVTDRTNKKSLKASRVLSFVIPFVHSIKSYKNKSHLIDIVTSKNMKSKRTAILPSSPSQVHHIIAIVVSSITILIGMVIITLFYKYKEKQKRYYITVLLLGKVKIFYFKIYFTEISIDSLPCRLNIFRHVFKVAGHAI